MEMLSLRPVCPGRLRAAPGAVRAGSERIFRPGIFIQIGIGPDLAPQKKRAKFSRWTLMPGMADTSVGFYSKDPT